MQKIFLVYAHPEPKSINGALLEVAVKAFKESNNMVEVSDLYGMSFNPTSGRHNFTSKNDPDFYKQQLEEIYATQVNGFAKIIEEEIQKVEKCDLMIWQFPLWWFSVPAILKGWVDRVFAMGRTYGDGRFYEKGVFGGKRAMLSVTVGGAEEAYLPGGFNGDIMGILRPIHRGMLQFTGFTVLQPHIIYSPARKSEDELKRELSVFEHRLQNIWGEPALNVGIY